MRVDDNRRVEVGEGDYQHCKREVVPETGHRAESSRESRTGEQRRNKHQSLREDDRHHIRGIHLQRNVLTYAAVLFVTDDTLCILYRDLADRLYQSDRCHEDKEQQHQLEDQHDGATRGSLEAGVDLGQQRVRETCHDTDHNDQRDTVTDTLVGDLLAQPHDEHGSGDQDRRRIGNEAERIAVNERSGHLMVQVGDVRRTLQDQHADRQEACPLVHLAAAALTLLLHFLEIRNHHTHELDDDRGGDVRHDSERENSGVAERTAGEDVQQTQKSVAFQLAGIRRTLAQGVGVDARNHDETTQAVDQQKPDRVNDTLAKLLDLVDILERFYQFLVGRQKSDYHQKDDTNNEILIHNFWVLRLLTVFRRCPRLP